MLSRTYFAEKKDMLKIKQMKRVDFQIVSNANLETGLKGSSVNMLQRKTGPKMAGPAHFELL
jgi:hypothetical protein